MRLSFLRRLNGTVTGVGVDLVRVRRVKRAYLRRPERFLKRIFSTREQVFLSDRGYPPGTLAARFAAKEAVAKALGSGIGPVRWSELEILPDDKGAPTVCLSGNARQLAEQQGINGVAVSLSHDGPWAIAFAVAYGDSQKSKVQSPKSKI